MRTKTYFKTKNKSKKDLQYGLTVEQMLESKTLQGLIIEQAEVEDLEKLPREQFMDNLAEMIRQSKLSANAMEQVWELYVNEARKRDNSLRSVYFGNFIQSLNYLNEEVSRDFLDLQSKDVKFLDRVKDLFLSFGEKEKITLQRTRMFVEVSENLQDILINIHKSLLAVVTNKPLESSEEIKKIFLKEFAVFEKNQKKYKWNSIFFTNFISSKERVAEEVSKILSLLSAKILQAGLARLQKVDVDFSDKFLRTLQAGLESSRSRRPAPSPASPRTPAVPTPSPEPEDGAIEVSDEDLVKSISKDEIERIINNVFDSVDIDPDLKPTEIYDKIEEFLRTQNIVLEKSFFHNLKKSLIFERMNRMAGLPPTED